MKTTSWMTYIASTLFALLILTSQTAYANNYPNATVENGKIVLTIPYLEYQGIDGTEAYSVILESTTDTSNYKIREGSLLFVPIQCHEPRPQICTTVHTPVCANLSSSPGTQASYSNACEACRDSNISSYTHGACE